MCDASIGGTLVKPRDRSSDLDQEVVAAGSTTTTRESGHCESAARIGIRRRPEEASRLSGQNEQSAPCGRQAMELGG